MIVFFLATVLGAEPAPPTLLHYRWTPGETLRYLIQRDPYFADPPGSMEMVTPEGPYRPPVVERLAEKVLSVAADGTAELALTLIPEPGFEDEDHPQAAVSRTVRVSSSGKVLSVSGAALGNTPAEQDLLRGIVLLTADMQDRKDGTAVKTGRSPAVVTQSTSPNHDGTLLQTTSAVQADHLVFDCLQGQLVREVCTKTITLSLVMTGRGRRGSDDFGHVVPNAKIIQTLSVERRN